MGTPTISDQRPHPSPPQRSTNNRLPLVIVGSLLAGLAVAAVLVVVPILPAQENVLTGAALLGFALGWALLAVLSVRLTDQPQRWAAVPATFLAVSGIVAIGGSDPVEAVFAWL
ncbi:hypothetical protein MLP_40140 [Microlunatus phosphovorus NM-1]|uniref:Uncharacterized protein n=1 Tax=Microlunatus phosphovorus (strain ATCC 700054 / DSM 10555 / JCM 9379 / NBRC 101784 / NCIMB 13414 / VKM Ac-1990 / NM-1) TaxID=1032480 RepID=F5XR06_MICPN|nr:hypothetical protein [Microlunatus phosphovorus]BAK37028.1 hypothetical protein MLP_40140 [Microlunatus phosphovorus NM-1]